MAKKKAKKTKAKSRATTGNRERVDTARDHRYVRRDRRGRFDEVEDVGRSAAQDQKRVAKTKSRQGQGDRGDR
jgi:hypothetical protein